MVTAQNPILPGFYPDPSICRVGEDYFLAASSFAYAPGVPLFHSKDLASWRSIGHALTRREQLPLAGAELSEGIYAPCLRHHKGVFYLATTNLRHGGNFYVTAEHPGGPWSDPVWLPDAPGIDPSLFFEGDRCWYVGQREKEGAAYFGDCEIWCRALDLATGRLTGETAVLWDGALKRAFWPEGPRLYKREGWYYLLIAEGGTGYEHSVCAARSERITGPYQPCPRNPVFTHRHLGRAFPVQNTGHGDLVQTQNGDWYMVLLATRPLAGCAELGRETFLARVEWEDGWPVINPGAGRLLREQPVRLPGAPCPAPSPCPGWRERLARDAVFFRYPADDLFALEADGRLALRTQPNSLCSPEPGGYIGVRLLSREFAASAAVAFDPRDRQEAGLLYLYNAGNHLRLTIRRGGQGREVWAVRTVRGEETAVGRLPLPKGDCTLRMQGSGQMVSLYAGPAAVAERVPVRELCAEAAGGFVGCTVGIYAAARGGERGVARFAPLQTAFG